MSNDRFEYILAVAREKNLTRAAQHLYISQPALTVYINKLEEQLGVKLFDRSVSPIRITYAGEQYIACMQSIERMRQDMFEKLKSIATNDKVKLTLGIGSGRGCFWLPYIIPEFLRTNPNVDINIVEGSSSDFESKLTNFEMDLCIMPLPIYSAGIDYEVLQDEIIMLAVPPKHRVLDDLDISQNSIENLLSIPPERLNGQCFICPERGYGLNRITYQMFGKYSIKPGEIKVINNSDTAYRLACFGFGLVFSPLCSAFPPQQDPLPVFCTLDNPPFIRKLVAAYNKNVSLPQIAKSFIETTKRLVNTHPDLRMP